MREGMLRCVPFRSRSAYGSIAIVPLTQVIRVQL